MVIDRARTVRGALAGVVAAGTWAAQQPVDKLVFGVDYDDTELLGKAFTRGPAWPVVGMFVHLGNGAALGALYAVVAPRLPVPSWSRGPLVALAEHLATWPLTVVAERVHPARDELPKLSGSAAAFAQATWRHLLFGVVLGELERRLNPPADPELPPYEHVMSSNGHGRLEHAGTPG
ncbi:MAG TPA: hypothetical protein VGO80_13700 [Solirubrobacteraceae bacterium]|jgi:hypothetical protein|nr:hypothetical protein [Solirubrobacteraceae bacterium]